MTLRTVYWGAALLFCLPLALIVWTSVFGGAMVGTAPGLSFAGYRAALADPAWRDALTLSCGLALGSAALAVVAGTWIALASAEMPFVWLRLTLTAATLVPLVTPGIVHAVALRMAMRVVGLPPGMSAILLGHAIHATPYVAIMVGARLATLSPAQVAAARTLGARPLAAFRHVIAPWLAPALLCAAGLAALSSFDDVVRSFFLGGYDPTLPVLLLARLRGGLTPEIDAVSTLVLMTLCLGAVVADRMAQKPGTLAAAVDRARALVAVRVRRRDTDWSGRARDRMA